MNSRGFLLIAAALLTATAVFHATGLPMVSDWLEGGRQSLLKLLWLSPAFDWLVVALLWVAAALRPSRNLVLVIWISALIPLYTAVGLILTVGLGHPGLYMLLGSILLALIGARRLD